jgi:hypothetical protein
MPQAVTIARSQLRKGITPELELLDVSYGVDGLSQLVSTIVHRGDSYKANDKGTGTFFGQGVANMTKMLNKCD